MFQKTAVHKMKRSFNNASLLLPISIFILIYLPFINTVPFLDGNIDFVKCLDFYNGGIKQLLSNWGSVHPPTKEVFIFILFKVFGVSATSYNLLGLMTGIAGIGHLYFLAEKLIDKKRALLVSLLLSISPLFIANSLFTLTDYLLAVGIVAALFHYLNKDYFLFAFYSTLAAGTKETGILLPVAIIFSEILLFILKKAPINEPRQRSKYFSLVTPFLFSFLWYVFLQLSGKGPWSDWNFSEVASKGTFYTIFHNVLTMQVFNKYAYQNWKQLGALNFNWLYWCFVFYSFIQTLRIPRTSSPRMEQSSEQTLRKIPMTLNLRLFIFHNKIKKINIHLGWLIAITFCFFYSLLVLSFQTYTIPRYALPIYPFMYLFVGWAVSKYSKFGLYISYILISLTMLSLISSIDPVSTLLWKNNRIMTQSLYNLPAYLDGNDGLTYNLQYLLIAKTRSDFLLLKTRSVTKSGCYWLSPDPNNDQKTFKALSINPNIIYACK